MNGTMTATRLAEEWWAGYLRETLAESGDADGYIARLRETAEQARPDTEAHQAFALLLERLREADFDGGAGDEDQESSRMAKSVTLAG